DHYPSCVRCASDRRRGRSTRTLGSKRAIVTILKKFFGTGSKKGDGDPPDFAAFLEGSMEGLRIQTAAHQSTWGLGQEKQWNFEQDRGELLFTFPDKIAKAPAQIIGTFDG